MDDATAQFVAWVRGAAPYIHAFRGRTFVVGFGGEVAAGKRAQSLAYDCNLLAALGIRLVLVHGARPQIDAEQARRGLEPRFHHGLRVTDPEALECVKSAMAVTRFEVEALLSQGLPNTPMAGSYIRVTGGNFITARPVGVVDGVDYQYTGAVRKIIAEEINADLDQQNVVLITPLGVSPAGEIFNLAMEEVAEAVAVALKAEKLIYLCDAPGLLDEDGQLVESVTADEAGLFAHLRRDHAHQVEGLAGIGVEADDIAFMDGAGRDQEVGVRIVGGHFQRGVLEFEAVAEDDLVALAGIVAEGLFEGGRVLLQLDIADLRAKLLLDALQRVVGDAVPAFFRNAAGHEKAHLEVVGVRHAGNGQGDGQRCDAFQEQSS